MRRVSLEEYVSADCSNLIDLCHSFCLLILNWWRAACADLIVCEETQEQITADVAASTKAAEAEKLEPDPDPEPLTLRSLASEAVEPGSTTLDDDSPDLEYSRLGCKP